VAWSRGSRDAGATLSRDHSSVQRYWQETDNGEPVAWVGSVADWATWLDGHDVVVATTRVADPDEPDTHKLVSTVFLGYSLHPTQRPPLLYETLVFDESNVLARRLSTNRESADKAHESLVIELSSLQ